VIRAATISIIAALQMTRTIALDGIFPVPRIVTIAVIIWIASIPWILRSTSKPYLFSWLISIVCLLLVFHVARNNGGLTAPIMPSITIPILLAALLIGGCAAIILGLIAAVGGLGLGYIQFTGKLPAPIVDPALYWIIYPSNVVLTMIMAVTILAPLGRLSERMHRRLMDEIATHVETARALDSANDELSQHAEGLKDARNQLQRTFDSIAQGLVVFDQDARVVAWNDRYIELMEWPPGLIKVGVTTETLVRHSAGMGCLGPGDPNELTSDFMSKAREGNFSYGNLHMPGGRVLDHRRRMMPDGG